MKTEEDEGYKLLRELLMEWLSGPAVCDPETVGTDKFYRLSINNLLKILHEHGFEFRVRGRTN